MSYSRNNLIIVVAMLGLMAAGCSKKEKPAGTGADEGIAASKTWLAIIDAAQYDDSWEQACAYFKGVVPKDQWVRQMVVVQYRTSFQNKTNAVETVTPMRDPDGVYRVSGYYIR